MGMDKKILELAAKYRDYTAENLSKLVKVKSYSSQEEDVCRLIVTLLEEAGFEDIRIAMG
jgi:acetylornithine deacetylase/succinyl-diaminopimelate desuccinylase-like protein